MYSWPRFDQWHLNSHQTPGWFLSIHGFWEEGREIVLDLEERTIRTHEWLHHIFSDHKYIGLIAIIGTVLQIMCHHAQLNVMGGSWALQLIVGMS